MTGISFALNTGQKGCTTSSTTASCYTAHVAWTGDGKTRACDSTITSAADNVAPSATTLPVDLFTPVSTQTAGVYAAPPPVIVVDITYLWRPWAFSSLIGAVTVTRSAYVNARYMTELQYQKIGGDDGFGAICDGGIY